MADLNETVSLVAANDYIDRLQKRIVDSLRAVAAKGPEQFTKAVECLIEQSAADCEAAKARLANGAIQQ